MTYLRTWEEFEKAAEMLYLENPTDTRYAIRYSHSKAALIVKITDNKKCFQYKTEVQHDVRKIDKFVSDLLRHMASNDNHQLDVKVGACVDCSAKYSQHVY